MEQISWNDSRYFARMLGEVSPGLFARLPSEAEWEYACRAGTDAAFHDGSPCTLPDGMDPALDKLGWFDRNSEGKTHPVKGKRPNAWGLYDMHGNVWEWCEDPWDEEAYRTRAAEAEEPWARAVDENLLRVVRGGSWDERTRNCRAALRSWGAANHRGLVLGMRLAADQEPAEPQGAERRVQGG